MSLSDLHLWHPFTHEGADPAPLVIRRGQGVFLETQDGRRILDAISSWWVNLHGHSHPAIADAIAQQAARLEHVLFAGFSHEPAEELAARLGKIVPAPLRHVFFSDDGSTAVEVALKMAIQYWHNRGVKNKTKIIALEGAYHGDTFGSMSVGTRGVFTNAFAPYLFDVVFIDFPTEENKEKVLKDFEENLLSRETGVFMFPPAEFSVHSSTN